MNKTKLNKVNVIYLVMLFLSSTTPLIAMEQKMTQTNSHSFHSLQQSEQILDKFIQDTMEKTGTVGMSIAIVEKSKIVFSKGYGVKQLHSNEAVKPDTRMMIGAVTIPLTSMLLAKFVDEHQVKWTDPVVSIYPDFKLADPSLTQTITLQQLLSGNVGIPRKDVPFCINYQGQTAKNLFDELALISPLINNPTQFQYQNHTPAALGYILGHAAYPNLPMYNAYTRLMDEKIFIPMEMKRTTFNLEEVMADNNYASPHWLNSKGQAVSLDMNYNRSLHYVAPTGGAWSTSEDIAKFLITELNLGVSTKGKIITSKENTLIRRAPQIKLSPNNDSEYAIGWMIEYHEGKQLVQHAGNAFGYATYIGFYPEEQVGVVILANNFFDYIIETAIQQKLNTLWFNSSANPEQYVNDEIKTRQQTIHDLYNKPCDTAFLEKFQGIYANPEIGEWHIKKEHNAFVLIKGENRWRLSTHQKSDGKIVLIGLDPIMTWLNLEFIPKDEQGEAFDMVLRQERYTLTRVPVS